MLKNQKGFHLTYILLVLLVIGATVFAGMRVFKKEGQRKGNNSGSSQGANRPSLADCSQQPLSKLPADLSKLEQIAPLGGVDPPDHTLPTDHMYMMYTYGDTSQKELYAPADITITTVAYSREIFNGTDRGGDYRIDFYPCSQLKLIYGHVDVLADKIKAAIGTPDAPGKGTCRTDKQATSVITNCNWDVNIKLSAGEFFGSANGWDLWATYEGNKGKVLTADYYYNTDAVCPLDYWTADLRTQLYAKVLRTAEPRCGEAYQDVAGTLQGGWFAHKDPQQAKSDWASHFSLTHHSVSNIGQLAVAGTISSQFMYNFTPKTTGTINIEPSKTVKGTLYCYQHEGNKRFPNGRMAGDGKVLLKLTDDHTMQIEKKDGACSANETLSKPTTYYR